MKINTLSVPIALELSRRNLEVLLAKLDELESKCSLMSGDGQIIVTAVENEEHYSDRDPGVMLVRGKWV